MKKNLAWCTANILPEIHRRLEDLFDVREQLHEHKHDVYISNVKMHIRIVKKLNRANQNERTETIGLSTAL